MKTWLKFKNHLQPLINISNDIKKSSHRKYSSSNTLRNYKVLDSLYEKYFSNMATYDQFNNILEKHSIKCVNAIHPFGDNPLTKWSNQLPQITPDISSILLSQDVNNLSKILSLINK